MKKQTQNDAVLRYLIDNGSITQLEAINELGCTRLASRIHDLREKGFEITSKMEKVPTRYGSAWVAVYRLVWHQGG